MLQRTAAILLLAALPAVAFAQLRTIPADAKPGKIRHVKEMDVALDGKTERLAAGAQIRDASNRIIVPMTIPADAPVKYRRDAEGRVHQVWILTPAEAAEAPAAK
jgi:hypothetical protein